MFAVPSGPSAAALTASHAAPLVGRAASSPAAIQTAPPPSVGAAASGARTDPGAGVFATGGAVRRWTGLGEVEISSVGRRRPARASWIVRRLRLVTVTTTLRGEAGSIRLMSTASVPLRPRRRRTDARAPRTRSRSAARAERGADRRRTARDGREPPRPKRRSPTHPQVPRTAILPRGSRQPDLVG